MEKYSFEFKLAIVQEYLEGKGGLGYLAKKVHGWINAYRGFGEEGLLCKQKKQSYSFQLKIDAMELYQTNKLSYREVANHLEINQPALVVNWMKFFCSKGLDGLSKMKGCSSILSMKEEKEEIGKLTPKENDRTNYRQPPRIIQIS